MRNLSELGFAAVLFFSVSARAAAPAEQPPPLPGEAIVTAAQAIVHEQPDVLSDAKRLLYGGEIVKVLELVRDPQQALWARIAMGVEFGFVRESDLKLGSTGAARQWRPNSVTRDDRPLAFSLRAGAELFGAGMAIHYLPFSRLGMTFSVGSIIDGEDMKGTAISTGALSYLALHDVSPFVEMGFTRLSYHQEHAILRVSSFYLTLGLEWIFRSGVFINGMVTYARSTDVEVAFDYDAAEAGPVQVPADFGILDPGTDATFQFILPGVSLGYAF
jgi:hypothetical protein